MRTQSRPAGFLTGMIAQPGASFRPGLMSAGSWPTEQFIKDDGAATSCLGQDGPVPSATRNIAEQGSAARHGLFQARPDMVQHLIGAQAPALLYDGLEPICEVAGGPCRAREATEIEVRMCIDQT